MEFTSIYQDAKNDIAFEMRRFKQNPINITIADNSTLTDLYNIAKTRMFTKKWQYYGNNEKSISTERHKNMDDIMDDIKTSIVHDIFVTDDKNNEIFSIPNSNKKTLREFINENKKFFSKSAAYTRTIYTLYVVDELCVRELLELQNKPKQVSTISRYINCVKM